MAGFEITGKERKYTWKNGIMRVAAVFCVLVSVFGAYFSVFEIGISLIPVILLMGIVIPVAMLFSGKGKYPALRRGGILFALLLLCWMWRYRLLEGIIPFVNSYVDLMNQFYNTAMPFMDGTENVISTLFVIFLLEIIFSIILLSVIERGRIFAVFIMLLPVILAAVVGKMPQTIWCWCLMAAGILYLIVCHQDEQKIPIKEIVSAVAILVVLFIFSSVFVPVIHGYKETNIEAYKEIKHKIILSQQIDMRELVLEHILADVNFGGGELTEGKLKNLTSFSHTGEVMEEVVLDEKPEETVYWEKYVGAVYEDGYWEEPKTSEYSSEVYINRGAYGHLEELNALCSEVYQLSAETVSSGINEIFDDGFRYTDNPGKMPEDRDFAEGFLFEKKEGFCVHFATAATLIYRVCGIPARYVEGYRIEPEEFVQQSDGTYKAVVTDYMAHAWCETYRGDQQWKVREHTIGSQENDTQVTPTNTPEPENTAEITPEATATVEETIVPEENIQNDIGINGDISGGQNSSLQNLQDILLNAGKIAAVVVCSLAVLTLIIVLQQKIRRQRKHASFRKKKGNMGVINIYRAVCELCEFVGVENSDVSERERIKIIAGQFPQLSEEEWDWMYDCAERAAFAGKMIMKEEQKEMLCLYRKLRTEILETLPMGQKLWFLYGKCH